MAITLPIVTEFSDKGIKSAEAGFKNFKAKVAEAEGGMGKFKAGFGAATEFMSANAATFAATAGVAIGKFVFEGIQAFQELALAAGKFSDATGLAVEDASRWMEVAGDIGIEAKDVETMIGKMNKALGMTPELFTDLQIPIARTKDGLTDVNETFLNAIKRIQSIKDPTERAAVAAKLFGKGWQGAAELINMNIDDIKRNLADVSDAKVITTEEVDKARKLREETDKLSDAWEDFKITMGEWFVPGLTKTLGFIADPSWSGFFDMAKNSFMNQPVVWAGKGIWNWITGGDDDPTTTLSHFNDALGANRNAMQEAREQAYLYRQELSLTDEDLNGLIDTWDEMTGRFNDEATWNRLNKSFEDMMTAGKEAFGGNKDSADEFIDKLARVTGDVGKYIAALGDIPLDVQSDLQLLWDKGEFQAVINYLDKYRAGVIIPVWAARREAITPSGQGSGRVGYRAPGSSGGTGSSGGSGSSAPPPPAPPAAQQGPPELNIMGQPWGSNGGGNVTVHVAGSVTTEGDLVENIRRALVNAQRNGAQLVYNNT